MSILVSDVQSSMNMFRRSTETADFTAAKSLEAVALAIEDVHSQALFRFTQRVQRFDFLDGHSDYVISDNATNFEASVRAPDFRAVKDLRLAQDHTVDFDFVDPNFFAEEFGRGTGKKLYAVELRDGANVLRVNQPDIGSHTSVQEANDHDSNGTWTADATNSDALNVSTDSVVYQEGNGSVKFDADVSQSGNNKVTIENSDMTSVDLSAFRGTGVFRFWVYLPDVTDDTSQYITSVEFRWGSDSSNYWSLTRAKPVNSAVFQDRWNLMEFAWRDATETGTVDETAIDYLLVTINYSASQADAVGFRINDINCYNPKEMKLVYFSNYTVATTSTNVWKPRATATTDILLAPDLYKNVYVDAANWYMMQFLYPLDAQLVKAYELKYKGNYDSRQKKWKGGSLERLVKEQGERLKLPQRHQTPQLSWD